ncbi:MAG TPA: rhodanese-like domain-containing protein [Pyrinomonadaceae bacterium]|nr:rhodanese-like domain-containing protein [Pyrinomonadaceae bacterium]
MSKNVSVILLTACAGVVLAACAANDRVGVNNNSGTTPQAASEASRNASATVPTPPPAAATPADGVRRITVADLQSALEKGEAVIVDVRSESSYAAGHIKGARVIPEDQITRRADELPRDKLIVTYCA